MQLEKDNDDPNTQPRCNQDKIELDERYFIGMQEKGAGLQIALQLATADSHLEPATITTILLSFADHQEFSYYCKSVSVEALLYVFELFVPFFCFIERLLLLLLWKLCCSTFHIELYIGFR